MPFNGKKKKKSSLPDGITMPHNPEEEMPDEDEAEEMKKMMAKRKKKMGKKMPVETKEFAEQLSYSERTSLVYSAFRKQFNGPPLPGGEYVSWEDRPEIDNVYEDFVVVRMSGAKYKVDFKIDSKQNVTFTPNDKNRWPKAEYEVKVSEMDEDAYYHVFGEESKLRVKLSEGVQEADVVLIKPGAGNKKDNHYYSKEVLKQYAKMFEGANMYTTNHDEKEHNVRNRVAVIKEAGKRFTKEGSPIARIAVTKKSFWEELKTMKEQGILDKMQNSILAVGKARRGVVDGKEYNIVESIDAVKSVDFVPRAGAGGHVFNLIESSQDDLDLLTLKTLMEKRPDLVKELERQIVKNSQGQNPSPTILQEVDEDMAKSVEELESQLQEAEETNSALDEENQALKQENAKLRAATILSELTIEKKLSPAVVKRVKQTIEEGYIEESHFEEAKLKEIVTKLVDREVEYLKESLPTNGSRPTNMGESYQEEPPTTPADTRTFAERQAATDAVLAQYIPNFGKGGK